MSDRPCTVPAPPEGQRSDLAGVRGPLGLRVDEFAESIVITIGELK